MDLSGYEMEDRLCRCKCGMTFKVWKKSKQRYYSKNHEWFEQSVVKKNAKYSRYYSKISMGSVYGNKSKHFVRELADACID